MVNENVPQPPAQPQPPQDPAIEAEVARHKAEWNSLRQHLQVNFAEFGEAYGADYGETMAAVSERAAEEKS